MAFVNVLVILGSRSGWASQPQWQCSGSFSGLECPPVWSGLVPLLSRSLSGWTELDGLSDLICWCHVVQLISRSDQMESWRGERAREQTGGKLVGQKGTHKARGKKKKKKKHVYLAGVSTGAMTMTRCPHWCGEVWPWQ